MDLFYLKLFLSFVVGGGYIAFTIWVSEKFGSRIGGIVIGLPSTGIVSLIFIAWTQDAHAALSAIPVMPVAFAVNSLFVITFITLYRHGELRAIATGILLWLALTLPLAIAHLDSLASSLALAAIIFAYAITHLRKYPSMKLKHFEITRKEFLLRSVFAGMIVAIAVLLGKALGPLWGGLFAAFPAAFSSSLILLAREHGITFASSVARSMPWGSVANVVFLVALYFLAPQLGFALGLAIGYALSVAFALGIYEIILKK